MPPAAAKRPAGVIIRDAHLQIDLRAQGFGRERLDLAPTPANIRYAERMRAEILGKIERGTFALADYFPDSPRTQTDAPSLTWGELADEWLRIKRPAIAHSTLHAYAQTLGSYHLDTWRPLRLNAIDYRQLMALLASVQTGAKTRNNIASVLRQVLEYAHTAELLREPLHQHITMSRQQAPAPDPLDLAEVRALLAKMTSDKARNYYAFAFFTGLRPSEQIALRWNRVDLRKGAITIDAARTRGADKGTKTGIARVVELNATARAALERQRAISQMAGDHVFIGLDGQHYTTTDGPLDAWWKPAMRLAGIRYRDARQTRHTFATLCLHAGITPAWAARQLGHSVEMFFRKYSRWIEGADKGAERAKLDAFIDAQTGT